MDVCPQLPRWWPQVLTPSCTRTSATPGCWILLFPIVTQLYPSLFSSASSPGLATIQEKGLCPTSAAGCWPHPALCFFVECRKAEPVSGSQDRSLRALFVPWKNKAVVSLSVFPPLLILSIPRDPWGHHGSSPRSLQWVKLLSDTWAQCHHCKRFLTQDVPRETQESGSRQDDGSLDKGSSEREAQGNVAAAGTAVLC